ncbi:predicted protein [Sclerotinia sclerotiorum 1980 UF-70]|uniref:Uncharacterized protein n=1 Tax=Sclerotinia sclerotiorum (strain ATCC 18683 / 1980 / Ss-1) TaxID=665079 RepID=A7ECW5_SCLS1|nr:predicted protein [Sclerotinia sclerotiorum 1980 UF-70]EDO00681.1 predicted protein [Sclerotinia sclerotiorum 1980 UF-70]
MAVISDQCNHLNGKKAKSRLVQELQGSFFVLSRWAGGAAKKTLSSKG